MRIHIYYGGRGLMDDPTLYVIGKMQTVLEELNVTVERYNLYEMKNNSILTLPQSLKQADGIILATTVEWYGIGGSMSQFLDACWLYGDKEKISKMYMCPIVMSTTYGEREGKLNLQTAWEILGGLPCSGLCGYIPDAASLEMNDEYLTIIEKKAENLYRTINQKVTSFPASNQAVKQKVYSTKNVNFTPQETEQLSQYVADDSYMQTQKEDIKELASMFKGMLENMDNDDTSAYIKDFKNRFKPQAGYKAGYKFNLEGKKNTFIIQINGADCKCFYGQLDKPEVEVNLKPQIMVDIIGGRMTFQRAFMGGDMKMKGDFKALRMLDQLFPFMEGDK
ncbi:MAG: SCP2 sterol-binding domain-containing protein [Lachnospiraceae bacterium]|nr:SCP2 sterol-binding domain-containing protein [Lachnospiraceae bacterium]MBR3770347.1 SCP2 sterol-binding domain-containing protein [Lachnospiraceae bacterium]